MTEPETSPEPQPEPDLEPEHSDLWQRAEQLSQYGPWDERMRLDELRQLLGEPELQIRFRSGEGEPPITLYRSDHTTEVAQGPTMGDALEAALVAQYHSLLVEQARAQEIPGWLPEQLLYRYRQEQISLNRLRAYALPHLEAKETELGGRHRLLAWQPDQSGWTSWPIAMVVWDDERALAALDPQAFDRIPDEQFPEPRQDKRMWLDHTLSMIEQMLRGHPGDPADRRYQHLDSPIPWPRGSYSAFRYPSEPGRMILDESRNYSLEYWLERHMIDQVLPPGLREHAEEHARGWVMLDSQTLGDRSQDPPGLAS